MKHCPVCKTTYTDESLNFCLADGASLIASPEAEKTIQMSFSGAPVRINVPPDSVPTVISSVNSPSKPSRKGFGWLVIAALGALLLLGFLGVIGVVGYFSLREKGEKDSAAVAVSPTPAQIASQTPVPNDETGALKEKLANLEKQIQDRKNQKPALPAETSSPSKLSENMTARANSPGDGFLALRKQPDSETGELLTKIPHGASLTVLGCPKPAKIGKKSGRWCQVIYNGQAGWAFDAFLTF